MLQRSKEPKNDRCVIQRKGGESIVFAGVKVTLYPRGGRITVVLERCTRVITPDGGIPVYRVDGTDLTELPWQA